MLEVGEESPPTMVIKQRGEETKAHHIAARGLLDDFLNFESHIYIFI